MSKRTKQDTRPSNETFRFSGHETFACRFAWLPKAYDLLKHDPDGWPDDERAMVRTGLGKNMVRSLRFWSAAMGVTIQPSRQIPAVSEFGEQVFGASGLDPYLEHPATPWLLHWKLASNVEMPLFSWHIMFNRWPYPEFSRSDALKALARESALLGYQHSEITLSQHFDVLLHTYLQSKNTTTPEDSLDGPLVDLALVDAIGDRKGENGRREPIYSFRRGRKPEISNALFEYAIHDYWTKRRPDEATLSLRELCIGDGSPGRVFLLNDDDIRDRLEESQSGAFEYLPSAIAGRIVRGEGPERSNLLRALYKRNAQ
jgi:hypothetical protein